MRIYKYELKITDTQEVDLPKGAKVLSAQIQHGKLCIWATVDPNAPTERRIIDIYGTGHLMPEHYNEQAQYIGTVQQKANWEQVLVWHVFIRL